MQGRGATPPNLHSQKRASGEPGAIQYPTVDDARADVFDYVEGFHNPRIQRRLDSREREVNALTQPPAKTG